MSDLFRWQPDPKDFVLAFTPAYKSISPVAATAALLFLVLELDPSDAQPRQNVRNALGIPQTSAADWTAQSPASPSATTECSASPMRHSHRCSTQREPLLCANVTDAL